MPPLLMPSVAAARNSELAFIIAMAAIAKTKNAPIARRRFSSANARARASALVSRVYAIASSSNTGDCGRKNGSGE